VANDDFEQGPVGSNIPNIYPGWYASGRTGHFGLTTDAHSGSQAASLRDPNWGQDQLIQTIPTVAGKTYSLDFWLANTAGTPNNFPTQFNAMVGGKTLYHEVSTGAAEPYTEHTVQFTATGSSTQVDFLFHNTAAWHLDTVSVIPV